MKKKTVLAVSFASVSLLAVGLASVFVGNKPEAVHAEATTINAGSIYNWEYGWTYSKYDDYFYFQMADNALPVGTDLYPTSSSCVSITRAGVTTNINATGRPVIHKEDSKYDCNATWVLNGLTPALQGGDIITFEGDFKDVADNGAATYIVNITKSQFILSDDGTNFYNRALPVTYRSSNNYLSASTTWGGFMKFELDGATTATNFYPTNRDCFKLDGTVVGKPSGIGLVASGSEYRLDTGSQGFSGSLNSVLTINGYFNASDESYGLYINNARFKMTGTDSNADNKQDWEALYTCTYTNFAGTTTSYDYTATTRADVLSSIQSTITAATDTYAYEDNLPDTLPLSDGAAYTETRESASLDLAQFILFADTEGQCVTKYNIAKTRFNAISAAEQTTFKTSTETTFVNARARYEAWAVNQGDSDCYGTASPINTNQPLVNDNGVIGLSVALGLLASVSLGAVFFLKKRKQR